MGVGALTGRSRVAAYVVAHGARSAYLRASSWAKAPLGAAGRTPEKLVIAPQDLRTSDPTRAGEIYAGSFSFAGKSVAVEGRSPFLVEAPSREWAEALHGFGWLRHLRAADTTLAHANARALVDEWIGFRGGSDPRAHEPVIVARRLISWLCQSPLILDGADRNFYRRFLKSLMRQTRSLDRLRLQAPEGLQRLIAACALTYAGLCLAGETRLLKSAAKQLGEELERQILADGGHVSRNPSALVEILLDLLPLRQAFTVRNAQPPQALLNAIDRMMPMLRFFRHGDGAFAQFNGAGPTRADLVATALAYDDARGQPVEDAPHSGYQRLTAGETVALVDAGTPPPLALSREAHAGCLSFELSSGPERIVVNCGAPRSSRDAWEDAARATAAHSTAVIADTSSCRFVPKGRLRARIGSLIVAGPSSVPVKRERTEAGVRMAASHDGYADRFGVLHERTLTLSPDGRRLAGQDAFRPSPKATARAPDFRLALRFHLHPGVRARVAEDGASVALTLPSGAAWAFSAPGFTAEIEESVHLSGPHGPRRSEQIAVHASLRDAPQIAWSFERMDATPRRSRTAGGDAEAAPLQRK